MNGKELTLEEINEIISYLTFVPRKRFSDRGNEIQVCEAMYLNTAISMRTFFPFNVFSDPIDTFTVDLIVPADMKIEDGEVNTDLYTDEGYGYPEFKTIENAIIFIYGYKKKKEE